MNWKSDIYIYICLYKHIYLNYFIQFYYNNLFFQTLTVRWGPNIYISLIYKKSVFFLKQQQKKKVVVHELKKVGFVNLCFIWSLSWSSEQLMIHSNAIEIWNLKFYLYFSFFSFSILGVQEEEKKKKSWEKSQLKTSTSLVAPMGFLGW